MAIMLWMAVWVALWGLASILAVQFGISAWYPPAAMSLFLMIRYGAPAAPAIFAASLLAGSGQWDRYPGLHEILGSLGHMAAYGVGALLYRRGLPRHRHSIRPSSLALLGAAGLVGALLSAALGNLNIHLASQGAYALTFERVFAWFVGDFFGVVSLCPLLVFLTPGGRWRRGGLRGAFETLRVPAAALTIAVALASAFALISDGSDLNFRLVSVVGVGVYSVIVSSVVSPRSAVIYLFLVGVLSAAWLSTEVAPSARIEFALQISTFLVAAMATIYLSMDRSRARIAVATRRLRIRDLSEQRDALNRRISRVEAEFAQLAHEFRTPLGGIMGLIEIAEGGVATHREQAQVAEYFKHMRGCARYLNAMVDDAFDISRIARGRFEPTIEDFDLADLLDDLALISQSKNGDAVAFPAETGARPLMVRTDRNRLLQILINLVVNAVRYADRRGTVRVSCAVSPGSATLTVENASAAVAKAQIDACLAGGPGVATNSQGLGIGLPLVGKLSAGIGAALSTDVSGGVVRISITVPRV